MAALHHVGAAAPGPVTPTSDEAPAGCTAQGFKGERATDCLIFRQADAHGKRIATLTARAALLGLVLRPMADGSWQVLPQSGQPSIVQSLQAAEALVCGCELVRADVAALVGRLVPARGVQA